MGSLNKKCHSKHERYSQNSWLNFGWGNFWYNCRLPKGCIVEKYAHDRSEFRGLYQTSKRKAVAASIIEKNKFSEV